MPSSKPTLKDIAALAGVSTLTVHKAIHGKPGISDHTREHILQIAQELQYTVNPIASRLKKGTLTFAIVLPMPPHGTDQFFRKIWEGIDHAEKMMADYNVVLERLPCTRSSNDQVPIFESLLQRDDIHGVITYCWDDTTLNPYFEKLLARGVPVVTVDSDAVNSCRVGCVRASGKRTGKLAAELLCKLLPCSGRVILMSGNQQLKLLRDNSQGFREYIITHRPDLAILDISNACGNCSLEETLLHELKVHSDIIGVYCNSASNVMPMCNVLEAAHLPKPIVAIGSDVFDEIIPYLENGTVTATIWQAPELQSKNAVWMLYEYVSNQTIDQDVHYVPLGIVMRNNYMDYL